LYRRGRKGRREGDGSFPPRPPRPRRLKPWCMDVTDILRTRMQEPAGLQKMVSVSILLHAALMAAMLLSPRAWLQQPAEAPRPIMTITLGGGGSGPQNGGLTSIGGRAVQVQTPPEQATKREPALPPAAKTPEMT